MMKPIKGGESEVRETMVIPPQISRVVIPDPVCM